jgi:hypothetical protein
VHGEFSVRAASGGAVLIIAGRGKLGQARDRNASNGPFQAIFSGIPAQCEIMSPSAAPF